MLAPDEDARVDGAVLRLDERVVLVRREVVAEQRGALRVGRVVEEQTAVAVVEESAVAEAGREIELATRAGLDVVEDRLHLGVVVRVAGETLSVLREAQSLLLHVPGTEPADLARLDVQDPRAEVAGAVAVHRETLSVRVPRDDHVLDPDLGPEDAPQAGAIGLDQVAVLVLQVRLLVRGEGDLRSVGAELAAAEDRRREVGDRREVRPVEP